MGVFSLECLLLLLLVFCFDLVWVLFLFVSLFTFYKCIVPVGCLPWEIRVAFLGESQLRQSRATRLTVHAECFSVSIIHRTLTWTTGSSACARVNACECTQGCTDTVRGSALKVDFGRKNPCRTGESNLRHRRAGPTLYQLSYIPSFFLTFQTFSSLFKNVNIEMS